MEIIPAIIANNFAELRAKIKLVEPYVKTVQIDVMDGIFVSDKTWPYGENYRERFSVDNLNREPFSVDLEAHLMVEAPHRVLNEWLDSQVKRVILHWEALEKIHNHELLPYKTQVSAGFPVSNLTDEAHRCNKEFGVALNLETPVSAIDNFMGFMDCVLLMGRTPGKKALPLDESVIPKIIALRQKFPSVKIEVDGGVNLENAVKLKDAGADYLVVGSAIFESKDVGGAISELKRLATEYG